jgi:Ca-activated chloride channel family protein
MYKVYIFNRDYGKYVKKMKVKKQFNIMQLITIAVVLVILMQMTTQQIFNVSAHVDQQNLFEHEFYSIQTDVMETYGETNVTHVYNNPTDESVQVEFSVVLPKGAYLSNASITVSGQTFWAEILEIKEAEQSFENATEAGRSAVLIRKNSSQEHVVDVNVANKSKVTVSAFYVQRLLRVIGSYDLKTFFDNSHVPTVFKHEIDLKSPKRSIDIINEPNYYTLTNFSSQHLKFSYNNNFNQLGLENTFRFSLLGQNFGSNIFSYSNGTDDFFVATFSPVLESLGTSQVGKDFVFIIDVSGSMSGLKIEQAKIALNEIIDELYSIDRFGVIKFSSSSEAVRSSLVDRSDSSAVANIKSWVSALSAGGGTYINQALKDGSDLFKDDSRPKIMVLLTDGQPSDGSPAKIVEDFSRINTELGISLFSLGFGNNVDFTFLQSLSRANDGDALKISTESDASEQITGFYDMIKTPILVDLEITSKSGVDGNLYPYFLPNLYQGSEIFLVGKKSGSLLIEINGTTSDSHESWIIIDSADSSNASELKWVEKVYTIAVIDELLTQITYLPGDTSQLKAQVLDMALTYGIVTPYTALFIDVNDLEQPQAPEEGLLPGDTWAGPTPATSYAQGTYTQDSYAQTRSEAGAGTASFELISVLFAFGGFYFLSIRKRKSNK